MRWLFSGRNAKLETMNRILPTLLAKGRSGSKNWKINWPSLKAKWPT